MTRAEVEMIADAIRKISHGDVLGPTGMEMLAMAIAGEAPFANGNNLAHAIESVASQLSRIADALEAR